MKTEFELRSLLMGLWITRAYFATNVWNIGCGCDEYIDQLTGKELPYYEAIRDEVEDRIGLIKYILEEGPMDSMWEMIRDS
jgi:CRISPR/Cas system-associated exonuclease Cas4 (RecB family)